MKCGTLLQQEVDSIDVVATACMQQRRPSLLVFALHLALLKNVQQGHRKSGASSSSELNIKAKCADFHIMYAVSHIKHAQRKGSMMKLKVCFAPKFLARKIVVKGSQKGFKLCWKRYTFCLLTPARAENNYLDLKQKRSLCAWQWTHCDVFSKGPRAAYVPVFKFKTKRLQSRNPPRLWHLTRLGTSLWIDWKLRLPSSTV